MARPGLSISDIPLLTTGISLAGILSLSLAGMLPWPVFVLLAVLHAVVWRWFFHADIPGYLFGVVIAAVFLGEGIRIYLTGREAVLPALRDMIVILAVARFVLKKTMREIYQIVGISIAECILATVFTVSPVFLIGIMIEVLLIPIMLYLLDGYEFQAGPTILPPPVHWIAVFLGILATGAVLFFLIPRPSSTILSLGLAERRRTGFNEEVNLAHPGALEQDRDIVMRILWVSGTPPERFYLAGARLEYLSIKGFRKYPAGSSRREQAPVTDRLTLYPTGLDARNVFFPYTLVGTVPERITAQGVNYYWREAPPPFYDCLVSRSPSRVFQAVNLTFPEGMESVRALARRTARDAAVPVQVARLQKYLGTQCRYSLGRLDVSPEAPIQSFLASRRGVCEHFASAMAAMLRAVGIPARVVTGFLVSEFNTAGNYYIVRASDAHAWVEYWDGRAWRTNDPTPQASAPQRRASFIDAVRFRWIRWVIEYSLQDQINLAAYVKVNTPRLHHSLTGLHTWVGLILVAVAGGILALYLHRRRLGDYDRVLKALQKKGLEVDHTVPHEEHLRQLMAQWPSMGPSFERYLHHYLAWRFGGRSADIKPLTEAFIAKIRSTPYEPKTDGDAGKDSAGSRGPG